MGGGQTKEHFSETSKARVALLLLKDDGGAGSMNAAFLRPLPLLPQHAGRVRPFLTKATREDSGPSTFEETTSHASISMLNAIQSSMAVMSSKSLSGPPALPQPSHYGRMIKELRALNAPVLTGPWSE